MNDHLDEYIKAIQQSQILCTKEAKAAIQQAPLFSNQHSKKQNI
jgi:hypothetical protein